eukprot:525898_1
MYQRYRDNNTNSDSISISISPSSGSLSNHINSQSPKTMASRQWKQFQREFYSFIFSTLGKSIILVGIIFAFYFILSIIAMWSTYMTGENVITKTMSIGSISPYFCSHCSDNDYTDNIKDINMEGLLCYEPMDIVYTWVNGNDTQLKNDISIYKRQHEINENLKKNPNWTQPIGIKFNLILNGGTIWKWKNEFFDVIKDEIAKQLKIIQYEYKELVIYRPNKTVININNTNDNNNTIINVNITDNINGSIADIISNIENIDLDDDIQYMDDIDNINIDQDIDMDMDMDMNMDDNDLD